MWGAIIAAVAGIISIIISGEQQKSENKRAFQAQMDAQNELINRQNEYNSPSAQMARFASAGLNPHLIYGQGSPGQQPSAGSAPSLQTVDRLLQGRALSDQISRIQPATMENRLMSAQIDATNATTTQKYAMVRLNELQAQVVAKNPLLNDEGFKATIDGLKAAASLKSNQSGLAATQADIANKAQGHVVAKVFNEVNLLEQRFRLGQLDEKLKAEVLKSKEFQNAILEVQKKFMTDAEITPQHILQFVQLLLMKAL